MTYEVPNSLFDKDNLKGGDYALEMYRQLMRTALSTYRSLLSSGVPESDARLVLPRGYSDSCQFPACVGLMCSFQIRHQLPLASSLRVWV